METMTDQAANHEPSEMIRHTLALAESAERAVNDVARGLNTNLGSSLEAGAHLRNAAICTFEYAAVKLDELFSIAANASVAEATAQDMHRRGWEARRNLDHSIAAGYEKSARGYAEEATRLAIDAGDFYNREIMIPLAAVRYLISQLLGEPTP